jgi:thiamine biosynthesis lipoprotein
MAESWRHRCRPLLGTFVEVAVPEAAPETATEAAFAAMAEADRLMSVHRADSDVGRLNRAAGRPIEVHPWTFEVLELALELHRASEGVFDITATPLAPEAPPGRLALLPGLAARLLGPGASLDLGGIAKGYAVDRALDALRAAGAPAGLVNAGGDIAVFGPEAVPVAVRDPRRPDRLLWRLDLRDAALAASGGRHDPAHGTDVAAPAVLHPATRRPAPGIAGASVVAPSCALADSLTKVVMLAGIESLMLLRRLGAAAALVQADGNALSTPDWPRVARLAA